MESIAAQPPTLTGRLGTRVDISSAMLCALAVLLVVYLALSGGGYDLVVRNQVGIAVWWVVLLGALFGLLPVTRLRRSAWVMLALFAGFVAWTAISWASSQSPERSLDELSRVACYLGVLVLAVAIHRDRERAIRLTVTAIASAVVVVAALALLSRLRPGTFANADQTATFLPGTTGRLAWPLNYWNALAALMALGLPLLLASASSARTILGQAAAAAAVPIVALCGYLTFSRGGELAAAGGLLVYFVVTGDRIPKLVTALITAAGSAVLIAGAVHRSAIENGLTTATARHQGAGLLVAVLLVCAATALLQAGVALASRHGTPPRVLQISPARARKYLIVALIIGLAVALAAGAPTRLDHAWRSFKQPTAAALHQNSLSRLGSTSGNGRYDYWSVAVRQTPKHLITGWGPGTYQLVWLPHAPYASYIENAHSLYFETLVEDGVIGLAILVAFFVLVIGRAAGLAARAAPESRARTAGVVAACAAFAISSAVDWIWQVPVLPVAFLLLVAATFAPARRAANDLRAVPKIAVRAGLSVVAIACMVTILVPLATTNAVRASQAAAANGDTATALSDALTAARIDTSAASAQLQVALVLELRGDVGGAVAAIRRATADESLNWDLWLIRSRLEAEAGDPPASLAALREARALNPRSPVFATVARPSHGLRQHTARRRA